jgi:hypothetical protein
MQMPGFAQSRKGSQSKTQSNPRKLSNGQKKKEDSYRGYLNSSPQLRHLCGSLTNRNNSESKQVNGAPITATRIAHNGTVPLTTFVELHRKQTFAGTTCRADGCGAG